MNAIEGTPRAPSMLAIYAREAGYEFLRTLRMPAFAIPTLAFPAVFYLLFAVVLAGKDSAGRSVYMLATYGVFGVIGPALFGFGAGMANEREMGWMTLKRAAPMPMGAYFFGKIAMSLLFGLLVVLLLSALAVFAAGVRMPLATWLELLGTLMLGTLPFCAMGLMIGSAVRAQAAIALVNLVYMPMSVLSGLWIPLQAFPQLLQEFAVGLPPYHLAKLALANVGVGQASAVQTFAILAAYTTGFLAIAHRLQRRRESAGG